MPKRVLENVIKMLSKVLIFLFCACLVAFSCNDTTQTLSPLSPDAVILAFGDSLTYGTGANKGQDYPSVLARLSEKKVINEGTPGEISSKGLERLPALLDDYNPDLLILIHGGNDMIRKLPRTEMKQNLLNMISEGHQRNIEVIMLGVPEASIFLNSAKEYKDIAAETNVPVELSLLGDILGDNSLKSDAVHPNGKGYKILAEGIYNFLKQQGAIIE